MVGRARSLALLLVLLLGRWLLRPLFREIARHRSTRDLHAHGAVRGARRGLGDRTRSGSRWRSAGSSPACCSSETEFRHQTEAVIKPFQDILLGLFFVSVGMLLDLRLLLAQLPLVLLLLAVLLVGKATDRPR